jgi:hypothetical protein
MSTWRLQPVFSNTPRTCVRIVFAEVPPSAAMSSTVLPAARPRATRASAGVKSNSDCTSSTGGASNVLIVPTDVVQHGENGLYVFIIDDQNRAKVRQVKIAHQGHGGRTTA